jgi:alpha-L-fucosidase
MKKYGDKRDWFFNHRYGMFIHWGLYSVLGIHEQILQRRRMNFDTYKKLTREFTAEKFNAEAWLDLAETGGMEYICFTAKHHDGFCLWDTKQTDYNVMNTPCGRDILKELSDACNRRNMPLVVYYSVVDWHNENYPNYGRHHETEPQNESRYDVAKYMDFVKNQIREICTNYGEIHGIWWDMNVMEHCDESVNAMIHELQPQAVINDRGFSNKGIRGFGNGDFTTVEREIPFGKAFAVPTETCESVTMHSWGYKHDADFFSLRYLQQNIDNTMAMGGNFLLNVGPCADGSIAAEYETVVIDLGKWFNKIKASFYKTISCSVLTSNQHVILTRDESSIFVHIPGIVPGASIDLSPFDQMPVKATLLNAPEVQLKYEVDTGIQWWKTAKKSLVIKNIPADDFCHEAIVIKLDFEKDKISI